MALTLGSSNATKRRKKPIDVAKGYIELDEDPDRFTVELISPKGRGIRSLIKRSKGDFLLSYHGQLITGEEGNTREEDSNSTFRYFFSYKQKEWCIDATEEPTTGPSYGRLVNHDRGKFKNSVMKVVEWKDRPYLCLFATRDILPSEELLYDYGVKKLPWESMKRNGTNSGKSSYETGLNRMDGDAVCSTKKPVNNTEKQSTDTFQEHLPEDKSFENVPKNIGEKQCTDKYQEQLPEDKMLENVGEKQYYTDTFQEQLPEDKSFENVPKNVGGANNGNGLPDEMNFDCTSSKTDDMLSDSDEDYIPDTMSDSSLSSEMEISGDDLSQMVMDTEDTESLCIVPNSEGEEDDDTQSVVFGNVLNESITVQQCKNNERKREQKLQCCVYCEKLMTKVARHMERKHQNEKEVAKILLLTKKSKERRKAWQMLISKGNYHHNVTVLQKHKGILIPKYRPRRGDSKDSEDYLPCSHCFAFIVSTDLWKHQRSCPKVNQSVLYRGEAVLNGKLLIPKSNKSKFYQNVIHSMRDDERSSYVKSDDLILEFGERCYEKLGHRIQNHQYIAQRMRQLARLVIAIKDINPSVQKIIQCIEPENWNLLLKGVKKAAGFDEKSGQYETPSLAIKLGHSLKRCARIIRNLGAVEQDFSKQQRAESFLSLYEDEWTDRISSLAHETVNSRKFNKPKLLPTVEDISTMHRYLQTRAEELIKDPDTSDYTEIGEICLVQIILYNRKRSGEAERIELEQYKAISDSKQVDEEITKSLTKFELALVEKHKRIEIRGKKGSKVPVLFTNQMIKNINCFLDLRGKLQIDSLYLFAKPKSKFPIRGTDAMRKIAEKCGSKLPGLLKSTNLRKQLATISQVLNLTENDQDLLAKFLGHAIQIHREYYRLPESTLEIAKVSKVLHAINQGNLDILKNKTLEQIQINEEEMENESDEDGCSAGSQIEDDLLDSSADGFFDSSADEQEAATFNVTKRLKKRKTRAMAIKRAWTVEEKMAVERTLGKHIKLKSLPGKAECLAAISKEPVLNSRKWEHVKHYIRNRNLKKKLS